MRATGHPLPLTARYFPYIIPLLETTDHHFLLDRKTILFQAEGQKNGSPDTPESVLGIRDLSARPVPKTIDNDIPRHVPQIPNLVGHITMEFFAAS